MPFTKTQERIFLAVGVAAFGLLSLSIWYDSTHYSTREIEQAMLGKTRAEVRAQFGEPSWISDDGRTWHYNGKDIGHTTGLSDHLLNWYYIVMPEFDEDGRVQDVIIDD